VTENAGLVPFRQAAWDENAGERERQVAVAGQPVRVADARGGQPDEHLAGAGLIQFQGLDRERPVELLDDRGGDAH